MWAVKLLNKAFCIIYRALGTMAFLLLVTFITGCMDMDSKSPDVFVFLTNIDDTIIQSVRYHTGENFLGRQVRGYKTNRIICTRKAALQLKKAHDHFKNHGYKLVVYDGYRPQVAVDEFREWGSDLNDVRAKDFYYPTLEKKDLFEGGYVPQKTSMHSRGSAFDLTLIKMGNTIHSIRYSKRTLKNGDEIPFLDDGTVDMGASFDLFHAISHHDHDLLEPHHLQMRRFLKETMENFGFKSYPQEWWHYHLEDEPFPDTYFNFIVED